MRATRSQLRFSVKWKHRSRNHTEETRGKRVNKKDDRGWNWHASFRTQAASEWLFYVMNLINLENFLSATWWPHKAVEWRAHLSEETLCIPNCVQPDSISIISLVGQSFNSRVPYCETQSPIDHCELGRMCHCHINELPTAGKKSTGWTLGSGRAFYSWLIITLLLF